MKNKQVWGSTLMQLLTAASVMLGSGCAVGSLGGNAIVNVFYDQWKSARFIICQADPEWLLADAIAVVGQKNYIVYTCSKKENGVFHVTAHRPITKERVSITIEQQAQKNHGMQKQLVKITIAATRHLLPNEVAAEDIQEALELRIQQRNQK